MAKVPGVITTSSWILYTYIQSHKAANGTGTCQIGTPCICADSLADANITVRGGQERRLRNEVTDSVALRAWADRHLSASSGNDDNDGVCGSSVDGKGCCSTICGGSEYISKAACTSSGSGSNTGTETCTCTNKQAADDSYCSGHNSQHLTIACRVDETAAGRGGTTPICGICSEEQGACTISYDQTSGESCTCFDKKGSSVVTSDTGCQALWTGIYADSMCCGGMPPDVKTELLVVPTIRGLCIAALVSVIIGMLPIFLGGIGKIYGLEVFAMVSGTVGIFMQWCCGFLLAIIFIVIPFFIGVGLTGACETSKTVFYLCGIIYGPIGRTTGRLYTGRRCYDGPKCKPRHRQHYQE